MSQTIGTQAIGSTPHFHVQREAAAFPYFSHHDSVTALWAAKWRPLCQAGIYPFGEGDVADFDPIFADLVQRSGDDPGLLHRPDDYADAFLTPAARLHDRGVEAVAEGRHDDAVNAFLRAAAVYRIARFPVNRPGKGQQAWQAGKASYEAAGTLLDPPVVALDIPFSHADPASGDLGTTIPAYLRLPRGAPSRGGWPVLIFVCGLDAYRTDHSARTRRHVGHGFATISLEIPGTGDCPAAPHDPTAPDRLMTSVLDWIEVAAAEHGFDPDRVVARGVSTGGYYALRVAHTHADRLVAVVAQGAGAHHMFDASWVGAQNQMEYPFPLADALAYKFGFRDPDPKDAVARYAADGAMFSLLLAGILDRPACRMLAINGFEDSIFPIEDSIMAAAHSPTTDLIVRGGLRHMGNPGAEETIEFWLDQIDDLHRT